MIASTQPKLMTSQEYLEWETTQPIKYEYLYGEVYAMTGGTLPHNSVALNLASAFKNHLKDKGCKVFMADAKVAISEKAAFFYPNVMVTCHEKDQKAIDFIENPCLIIEVLSPSTEAYDRGKKFAAYRQLKSLQEYVLIDLQKMSVECFRLNEKNKWELTHYLVAENNTELS
jgi:Uma2 family endonuclease